MTDLRTEAMKMALEFIVLASSKDRAWFTEKEFEVVAALRQALAQPEQEPVAWVTFNAYGEEDDVWYENPEGKLLDGWTYKPLYTAPPKQEWVGLTDEEIYYFVRNAESYLECAKGIEAKLKEKNNV